jgi:hypothetical protein
MDIVRDAARLSRESMMPVLVEAATTSAFRELNVQPTGHDLVYRPVVLRELYSRFLEFYENPPVGSRTAAAAAAPVDAPSAAAVDLFERADDDAWLRTPRAGEPACVAGEHCEGLRCGMSEPLVARPSDAEVVARTQLQQDAAAAAAAARPRSRTRRPDAAAPAPLPARLCVVCLRYWTGYAVLNIRRELGHAPTNVPVSRYCSHAGYRGEYELEHCLEVRAGRFEGLTAPAVYHIRSFYQPESDEQAGQRVRDAEPGSVRADASVRYLLQGGYPRPAETVCARDLSELSVFRTGRRSAQLLRA